MVIEFSDLSVSTTTVHEEERTTEPTDRPTDRWTRSRRWIELLEIGTKSSRNSTLVKSLDLRSSRKKEDKHKGKGPRDLTYLKLFHGSRVSCW